MLNCCIKCSCCFTVDSVCKDENKENKITNVEKNKTFRNFIEPIVIKNHLNIPSGMYLRPILVMIIDMSNVVLHTSTKTDETKIIVSYSYLLKNDSHFPHQHCM